MKFMPICKKLVDDRGFCGCEPPFSPDAIPEVKLKGIARAIYPAIIKYYQNPENMEKFRIWEKEYDEKKARQNALIKEVNP